MAAVARSRELDHKQEQPFAPNRSLLENNEIFLMNLGGGYFNSPRLRKQINI